MQLNELNSELMRLGTSLGEEDMSVTVEERVLNLMLDSTKENLFVYGALRKVEAGTDALSMRSLLELNTMGKRTEGGHLGIVEGDDLLLYSRRYAIDALIPGILQVELKSIVQSIARLMDQTDAILSKAKVESVAAQASSEYDALSVTTAISYGWIQV